VVAWICLAVVGDRLGFASLTGIAMLYRRVRGRDGLGLGDAKLFAASGAGLGLEGLPAVLLVVCGAAIVALLVMAWRSQALSAATRIPFGPLSAFGTWIVWLYGAP
jgi:leader peptidase (prepilin peptidase) / N-methyltransferase